ncbi:LysR family transcriptional regulator [Kitasatospora kifunensis]|uniref:DNA-binding transcriptional LysR family regulator n=1 Tax=Kitasatospora kifunensis TaxID=58351 RepID=A0A7W7QXS5_KITKI|nr:LysR family transcriptional regulator [Kitasatospora kifunensis]MBB4921654.1 DNA-binding transcriptional LysR family regulator [Kitasatospora kifunensis]
MKYFSVLARQLHFGRAAEELGITQPALSQQIKALERELGVGLIVSRGVKGAELTKAGTVLLEGAEQILAMHDSLNDRIHEAAEGNGGTLNLSYSLSGASLGQRDLVDEFRRRHPEVRINTDSGCTANNLGLLRSGAVDAVFVRETSRAPDIESLLLAEEELVVVLPRGHQLASAVRLAPQALRGEPVAKWPRKLAPELHDRIMEQVWGSSTPLVVQEEPDYENLCLFVAGGTALAVMDRRVAQRYSSNGTVIRRFTEPVPTTKIAIAWRAGEQEPVVRRFVSLARENRTRLTECCSTPLGAAAS